MCWRGRARASKCHLVSALQTDGERTRERAEAYAATDETCCSLLFPYDRTTGHRNSIFRTHITISFGGCCCCCLLLPCRSLALCGCDRIEWPQLNCVASHHKFFYAHNHFKLNILCICNMARLAISNVCDVRLLSFYNFNQQKVSRWCSGWLLDTTQSTIMSWIL